MPTYLYCLTRDAADPPPGLRGRDEEPVRALTAGPVRAWVATVSSAPGPSAAALRHHDAVTSAALATGSTPLPVRFGEVFDSDADCVNAIEQRRAELLAALARVEGRVEMTVAVPLSVPPRDAASQPVDPPSGGPGRQYMERLRAGRHDDQILRQQGHVLSRPVVNAVRSLVLDERAALRTSPPVYLISHLIARESVDRYRQLASDAIGDVPAREPRRAVVRGPSAPYSFSGTGL